MIANILIGIAIGLAISAAIVVAFFKFRAWVDARIEHNCRRFFAPVKTHQSEIAENSLVKSAQITDNSSVRPPQVRESDEQPFWNNTQKLRDARSALEGGTYEPGSEPELANMTMHEAWAEIDARLLELNNVDQP